MQAANHVTVEVDCPVHKSFRVDQVVGMFDVPLAERCKQSFGADIPETDEDWQIGAIVGPSGSGKTTVAREVYGGALYQGAKWPKNKAVVDGFGERGVKEITRTLTAVGFSSPPAWVKPYAVLSNGEQFRCNLARAMLSDEPVVAFDEFTSVVDRTVAKIGSAAVAKAIRKGHLKKRFVVVTCHYDILEWLEPDWVVDMTTGELARGRLRRPRIQIDIYRCHYSAWKLFAKHHYLSASLNRSARCYVGFWDGQPVSFCAVLPLFGHLKNTFRFSRSVVLPDYQGVGIGIRTVDAVADIYLAAGSRIRSVSSHPAILRARAASPLWKCLKATKLGHKGDSRFWKGTSYGRGVVTFEYVGPKTSPADAPADPISETSQAASE